MKNKTIITTILTTAVFLTGALIVQAQTNVSVEAEQQTEVRADSETDDADDEQAQQEANYNNSRSNRSTVRDDGDTDGDGYGDVERSDQADTQANSTTSADIDANDEDDDGDGLPDGESDSRGVGVTKELDKASPKLMEAFSIGEDSPLRNAGVEVNVRSNVCSDDEDCDDDGVATPPGRADLSIRVSGSEVRGWDPEKKEAIRARLQAMSEMNTANDFGLRVASAALDNEDVLDITTDDQATEVRYQTRLRLLGFIPVPATAVARAETDGEVVVDYPWYSFLAKKGDESTFSQLAADLRADHDVMISVEEEGVKRTVRDEADEEN